MFHLTAARSAVCFVYSEHIELNALAAEEGGQKVCQQTDNSS
jgi:hypothetical protein